MTNMLLSRIGSLRVALMWLLLTAAAVGAEIRLAIVGGRGERDPGRGMADLIMTDLSRQRNLILLERERIDAILAEQDLGGGSLADPATVIRLGALLKVDAFLVVERLGKDSVVAIRAGVLDASTGIILGEVLEPPAGIEKRIDALTACAGPALAKLGAPPGDRVYVGILGFRSEDLGHELDDVAGALTGLLPVDLNRSPSLILLDRFYLDRLAQEKELTGVDLTLKSSAVLVSGGIRTDTERGRWVVTVQFRSTGRGNGGSLVVETPAGDLAKARQALAEAVLARLHAAGSGQALKPAEEAALFARQVEVLTQMTYPKPFYGEYLRVPRETGSPYLPLAEAAYALDPLPKHLLMVARLAPDPRGKSMFARYWREEARRLTAQGLTLQMPALRPPPATGGGERAIPSDQISIEQDAFRHEVACYSVNAKDYWNWWRAIDRTLIHFHRWCANTVEWGHYLREILSPMCAPPPAVDKPAMRNQVLTMLIYHARTAPGYDPFAHPEQAAELESALQWMRGQDQPAFHLASYMLKIHRSDGKADAEAARHLLDYARTIPRSHPVRDADGDDFLIQCVFAALNLVEAPQPDGDPVAAARKERCRRLFAMLDPLSAAGDTRRLLNWLAHSSSGPGGSWLRILQETGDTAASMEYLRKAVAQLKAFNTSRPNAPLVDATTRRLIQDFEEILAGMAGRPVPLPEDWRNYTIEPFVLPGKPSGATKLAALERDGDRLLMVWVESPDSSARAFRVWASTASVSGRRHRTRGMVELIPDVEERLQRLNGIEDDKLRAKAARSQSIQYWCQNTAVRAVAAVGDILYVATREDGLLVFSRGAGTVWNRRNRLPSGFIRSLTSLGDKAYFWLSEKRDGAAHGQLYVHDPASDTLTAILSTKSTTQRNALETEEAFAVDAMLGDKGRNCLWLGLCWGGNGLWSYDPGSGEFRKYPAFARQGIGNLAWQGPLLMVGSGPIASGLAILDLERETRLSLLGWSYPPMFGEPPGLAWPACLVDGELVMPGSHGVRMAVATSDGAFDVRGQGVLQLATTSVGLPSALRELPGEIDGRIRHLVWLNRTELLAADNAGACWKLTRSDRAAGTAEPWYLRPYDTDWQAVFQRADLLSPTRVTASSSVTNCPPAHIADRQFRTCWAADPTNGMGAWLEFEFASPLSIREIVLVNGWIPDVWKTTSYGINHRARTLRIRYGDGREDVCRLRDICSPQAFRPSRAVRTNSVRLTVEDLYPAEIIIADDPPWLNLAEVLFFGTPPPARQGS